jgi:ABC-type glutathione transport system ATPase component
MPLPLVETRSATEAQPAAEVLRVEDIRRTFVRSGGWFKPELRTKALDGVSFELCFGEILGIVGESGCGKSTLARIIVGLEQADSGKVVLDGRTLVGPELRTPVAPSKRGIQMVFQDPYASLNPRMRVSEVVGEGLSIAGDVSSGERMTRVAEALELVGLRTADGSRYPHEFSGGQRQRIGIARALVMQPRVLIADEAVSALDVSVQMQILNLLLDIKERLGLSLLFITHDISVVEYLCDRVVVLSQGAVVERATVAQIVRNPQHSYTKALISAVPRLEESKKPGDASAEIKD